MARLTSGIMFTGSLGDITAYKVKDSDDIFIRRKGGVSAKRIRKDPEFANTRRLNAEFAARSKFSGRILRSLPLLRPFADRKTAGSLNKLLKQIQDRDTVKGLGSRSIALSQFPALLEGFSFNAKYSFESFVSASINHSINKEAGEVTVAIPELVPGVNLRRFDRPLMCRLVLCAAILPDLFFSESGYRPSSDAYEHIGPFSTHSEWFAAAKGSSSFPLTLSFPFTPPDKNHSLVIGIGFQTGSLVDVGSIQPTSFGAGKIIAVR